MKLVQMPPTDAGWTQIKKSSEVKQKKVLCLFDYVARTGFGTVSKNIVKELKKHHGNSLHLDIIAINYFGQPYYEDDNTYVISARNNDVNDDPFGRYFFLKVLKENDYDGIFICQDLGTIVSFLEVLEHIKQDKKDNKKKVFKSIFYTPVDCRLIYPLVRKLEIFDTVVTYTEYGRKEINRLRPELKIKVVPHGNNPKDFYPLPPEEIQEFRKEFFGDNADKFIVTNINRNQPRKDIPNTIFGFIEAKKIWNPELPKPFLYLHTHPNDPMGWDIRAIMLQTDLVEDEDYKLLPKEYEEGGSTTEIVNKIYNASDVYLTTTLGEGWGLCVVCDTNIICEDSVKHIDSVNIADMVLTNDGTYHAVLDTTKRTVDSYIHIQTAYGYFLKATHEHPYYVLSKDGKISWKKVSEIKVGDSIGIVKPIGDRPLPEFIDMADYLPDNEGWVIEDDLVYNTMGFSPKNKTWSYTEIIKKYNTTKKVAETAKAFISGKRKAVSSLCIELVNKMLSDGYIQQDGVNKIKRNISVTDDLLWLIGLYIADGSSEGGVRVEFSLNCTTKKEAAVRVKNIIQSIFGITDVIIKQTGKRLAVRISSKAVANMFRTLCGHGAFNKKIPTLFCGAEKSLMPMIKGVFDGDGHINLSKNRISFCTVSPSLAYQSQAILASNNILISVMQKKQSGFGNYPLFDCMIPAAHLRRFMDATGIKGVIDRDNKRNAKPNFTETSTNFFVPVKSIKEIHEETEMHDLCVEGSHSFIGNGLVCHNTFSEAAACKLPVIAPYTTSFMEMSGYGKNAYMLQNIYPYVHTNDNVIREQTDIVEIGEYILDIAECKYGLQKIGQEKLKKKIEDNYKWVQKLDWKEVCKSWIEYLKIF